MDNEKGKVLILPGAALGAFRFREIQLNESCWVNGRPYFTPKAIGEWLEYAKPYFAVRKIIDRNPHIRTFATVVKLTTVEGNRTIPKLGIVEGGREVTREVEVYDPIGLQLIINKSNQPKAVLFQVAAAELVWAYFNEELTPSKWSRRGDLLSAARQILSIPESRKRRQMIIDLATREGISLAQTYRRITSATGERLKTRKGKPRRTRSDAGTHKSQEYALVIDYCRANPGARALIVKEALGLKAHPTTTRHWIQNIVRANHQKAA